MANDKEKLLKTTKKNFDTIGDALGKKLGAAIEKQDSTAESSGLEQVKNSFTKPVGTLTKIPDEVYKKIAETLNDNAKISSIFIEYSTDEGKCIKQVATQIGRLLKKLDVIKIPLKENGKTINYKVEFSVSHLGVSGSFIKVSRGNNSSWINWKDADTGKNAMAQYCASLYNLGKKVTSARKIIIKSLNEEGSKLLSAVFNDGTESVYKKVFGNFAFKKIAKAYRTSEIGKVVKSATSKKISEALTQYESLNNLYNNLAFEVNSATGTVESMKFWANSFASTSKTIQSKLKSLGVTVDLETLPILALDLVYNKNNTAVTLPANCTSEVKSSDYKSSVKIIYADTFTKSVTINGNAKDNKIYVGKGKDVLKGGDGNDTLSGGSGNNKLYGEAGNDSLVGGASNDSLWGGNGDDILTGGSGKNVFFYASGDGNDVIADFSYSDMIKLTKGSIKKVTKNGNDVTIKIGSGSIKIQNGKGKEITIVDADNFEKKYLNDKLISSVPSDAFKYNGHFYKIFNDGMTWEDAKVYCESIGGHLVTITDENEQSVVENLLVDKDSKNSYWLGGFKDDNDDWQWITNETFDYQHWGDWQPDGDGSALMMYCSKANGWALGDWNDIPADGNGIWGDEGFFSTDKFGFICEWDGGGNLDSLMDSFLPANNSSAYVLTYDIDEPNNLLDKVTFAQSGNKK